MKLPANAAELAATMPGLSAERKQQVIAHLQSMPADAQDRAIKTIISNGGEEGRLVTRLLGQPQPGPAAAPENKSINPVETK